MGSSWGYRAAGSPSKRTTYVAISAGLWNQRCPGGLPYVYPDNDLSYAGNFLRMLDMMTQSKYEPDPVKTRALDILKIPIVLQEVFVQDIQCWKVTRLGQAAHGLVRDARIVGLHQRRNFAKHCRGELAGGMHSGRRRSYRAGLLIRCAHIVLVTAFVRLVMLLGESSRFEVVPPCLFCSMIYCHPPW